MPRVRMRTNSAGPQGNRAAGAIYDVPQDEADALIAGGFAEWVDRPREAAAAMPPENAAVRTPRGRPAARSR